jgi:gluconokinase
MAIGASGSLESALSTLAPRLLEHRPDHDDTIVASPASAAAYDLARVSAAQRLRDLAAAADLLAGPGRPVEDNRRQPTGNKRQLVVGPDLQGLH